MYNKITGQSCHLRIAEFGHIADINLVFQCFRSLATSARMNNLKPEYTNLISKTVSIPYLGNY